MRFTSLALLLSGSLILAACAQQAVPVPATTPSRTTQATQAALPSVTLEAATMQGQGLLDPVLKMVFPGSVKFVTVEVVGSKGTRVFSAELQGGQVRVTLLGLPLGDPKYTVTIRAYDRKGGVVLYNSAAEINFASGKIKGDLTPVRVKAAVNVTAATLLPETSALTAKLGDLTQPMKIGGEQATTAFQNVLTASGLTVTVTGTTSDGQVSQTGRATFNHSEGGSRVNVQLTTVAHCPVLTTPVTAIPALQGSGAASPLVGQTVTVRGVVTGDFQSGLRGFFIQARDGGDNDPATSDGLFVYTGPAPQTVKPGDLVQLTGTVKEFYATTELDTISAFTNCASGLSVKPVELRAPFTDLERYEGMSVTFPETLTVTNNYSYGRYGELGLSAGGRLWVPTNGNVTTTKAQNQARLITLDDGNSVQNPASLPYLNSAPTRRTGDTVTGLTGVLHYANNVFKVEPTAAPAFTDANPRPDKPKEVGGTLKVAGANVLNYFTTFTDGTTADGQSSLGCLQGGVTSFGNCRGADNLWEFQRQQAKVVSALKGLDADIVTLMEVQNGGDTALSNLVTALNAAYGSPVYQYVATGNIGTDAIHVAIIYKPGRVTPLGNYVVDNNAIYSRPPLAQTFQDKAGGGVLTVVANHLKSKGSCPTSGDVDTGQGCWNTLRVGQATQLLKFVEQLKARSGDQDVLLMGDFNAYGAEDPIKTLQAGGFVSENLRIPADERYSYQFNGEFGYLDHALASSNLDTQVTGVTEWHINADEPTIADYNADYKKVPLCTTSTCTSPDLWQNNPYRATDHDPVLVGLNLTRDEVGPIFSVSLGGADSVTAGQPYTMTIAPSETPTTLSVNWGDGVTDTLAPSATTATHTYANAGSFTVTVTASTALDSATASRTVQVQPAPVVNKNKLLISQIYGGGGNSGATYTNDFIELFNAGNTAINLAGYSVQYAPATIGTTTKWQVTPLSSVNLAPGQYYLVQEAAGTTVLDKPLPTPDATGSIAMSASAGQVFLVEGTTALTSVTDASIRDYVSFSGLSNATAAKRTNSCADTDTFADFSKGAPAPRNTSVIDTVCP